MKKIILGIIILAALFLLAFWAFRYQDIEVVQNENNPSFVYKDILVIDSPEDFNDVISPLLISGSAKSNWYLDESFPILITDWDGLIIGEGEAQAQEIIITNDEDMIPFSATLSFIVSSTTPYKRGSIIFRQSQPAGGEPTVDAFELPVTFK